MLILPFLHVFILIVSCIVCLLANTCSLICYDFENLQKRDAPPGEKPEPVRTHLRNMIIVPEMIGSIIGVYNGKTFNQVEIKVIFTS